ncbi:MAG: 50S ribosomal protein L3 [Planctomycetota bacterium]
MAKLILGKKGRMSQMFTEEGVCIPVTICEVGPCYVTKVLTEKSDGYNALQVGFDEVRDKAISKAERGHLAKVGVKPQRHLREIRLGEGSKLELGSAITVADFAEGERVDIVGTSKGRGFAGVMKRHGFAGGRMTHGGMARRGPGAIGMSAYPGKVMKGKKMSGHMGACRVTTKNCEIVGVDAERNLLFIRGAVSGYRGGLIYIRTAKTAKVRKGN